MLYALTSIHETNDHAVPPPAFRLPFGPTHHPERRQPAPGFSVGRSEGNTNQEEGPAGAAQTWGFSTLILNNNAQPCIVLDL